MRVCSYCATLAFLLGVLVVLYLWPVFYRGLQSSDSPSYNAGYAGSGGYRGYGGYMAGTDTVAVGMVGMVATVTTVGMAGTVEDPTGGVSRRMRYLPPIDLSRG